jgi:hypothetical protein
VALGVEGGGRRGGGEHAQQVVTAGGGGGGHALGAHAKVTHRHASDTNWPFNDGQIPNPDVVRVAPGTRYHRVEGNRRASRNGPVSDLPSRNPYRYKVDTNCTALSLMPTINGNTVRSFSTHGHQSAAKGSSTTVSPLTSV